MVVVSGDIKILLLNLPQNLSDVKDYSSLLQPYSLALLSSTLKQKGYDVTLCDAFAYQMKKEDILKFVSDLRPSIVGFSIMTSNLPQTIEFIGEVRRVHPAALILAGGIHPTIEYMNLLKNHLDIDIIVRGEGERTTVELMDALQNKKALDGVRGIAYRSDGVIAATPEREIIQDLDTLPFADWASLPMDRYWDRWTIKKNYACMLLSRGCPYNCIFCGHGIIGKKYRTRSPQHIIDEIKMLYDTYHVRNLSFADSTLNVRNDWLHELCEKMISMDRKILWGCSVRADHVDAETIKLMKRAGCAKIFIGVESADNDMLQRMKKNESIEKIQEGIHIIRKGGLIPDLGFIIGMPGETKESIMKTINFASTFNRSVCSFTYATPYPGTELYEIAQREGFVVDDWSKFNTFTLAYVPQGFTEDEIKSYFSKAVKKTYLRLTFLASQLLNVKSWINFVVNVRFTYRLFFKIITKKA
ncbi:MAG: B12-binding domain-containing radical SAM protein [Candidatus Omnitrophica bacterium]|nr:B12-binding domain-containing radical SAM protein [Candidatus Omnitrophota bacterium]